MLYEKSSSPANASAHSRVCINLIKLFMGNIGILSGRFLSN
jgi:hypothetical protein